MRVFENHGLGTRSRGCGTDTGGDARLGLAEGVTPAGAGRVNSSVSATETSRGHSRGCGTDAKARTPLRLGPGSLPLVRDGSPIEIAELLLMRLTPARAGRGHAHTHA